MKIHILLVALLLKCANGHENESSNKEEVNQRQKFEEYFPSIYFLHGIKHGVLRAKNDEYEYPSRWTPLRPEFLKNQKKEKKTYKKPVGSSEEDFQLPPKWKPLRPQFLEKKPEEVEEKEDYELDDGEFHPPPKWKPLRPEFLKNQKKVKKPIKKPDSDENLDEDFQLPPKWKPLRPEFLQKKPEEVHEEEQEEEVVQELDDGEFHLPPKWKPLRPEFLKNQKKKPHRKPVDESPEDDFILPPKWKPLKPAFLQNRDTRSPLIIEYPRSKSPNSVASKRGSFTPGPNTPDTPAYNPDYPLLSLPAWRSGLLQPRWKSLRPEFIAHGYYPRNYRPQLRPTAPIPPDHFHPQKWKPMQPAYPERPPEYDDGYHTEMHDAFVEDDFYHPPKWRPFHPASPQGYDRGPYESPSYPPPSYDSPSKYRPSYLDNHHDRYGYLRSQLPNDE